MRIKNLLLLAAFLITSGGAMAQTTLTAANAKIVPGKSGDFKLSLTVPSTIAGWQAVIALPAGVTVASEDQTVTVKEVTSTEKAPGLSGSVKLLKHSKSHVVMGGIAESDGDGIAKGDLVIICFPTEKDAIISDVSKGLCTITLQADEKFEGPTTATKAADLVPNITVKSLQACDAEGNPDKDGKLKAASVTAVLYQLKYDLTGDGAVNLKDVREVIKIWKKDGSLKLKDAREAVKEWKL